MKKMPKSTTVDAYIASAPGALRGKLQQLRSAIRDAAPDAAERMSYGMPYYHYKGRLVYWGLSKNHIGVYIPTPTLEEHEAEVREYKAGKATLRFPLEKRLPLPLVKRLVRARASMNEALKKR